MTRLDQIESEPGYLYHGTSPENLESIAASGVRTHAPSHGTDQDAWPDGSTERRSYWSPRANVVWQFSPTPDCVVLRTRDGAAFRRERGTGDAYARRIVRARDLEVLTEDGWRPLAGVAEKNDRVAQNPRDEEALAKLRFTVDFGPDDAEVVATDASGEVVGSMALERLRPPGKVKPYATQGIWVHEDWQRKGVGSELYRLAIEEGRRLGHPVVSHPGGRSPAGEALHRGMKHARTREEVDGSEADVFRNPPEEEFNWREGGVSVSGVARGNVLSIDMFSSTNKGKGEAETALRKLRKRFREIHALGVGSSDSDPSWRFWRRMREKGLIEAMTDDMGTEVNPPERYAFAEVFDALRQHVRDSGAQPAWLADFEAHRCDWCDRDHRESERQYCHVGHLPGKVCYAGAADGIALGYQLGLAVHELGHLCLQGKDMRGKGRFNERDANEAGGRATGIAVTFRGEEVLEYSRVPKWFRALLEERRSR